MGTRDGAADTHVPTRAARLATRRLVPRVRVAPLPRSDSNVQHETRFCSCVQARMARGTQQLHSKMNTCTHPHRYKPATPLPSSFILAACTTERFIKASKSTSRSSVYDTERNILSSYKASSPDTSISNQVESSFFLPVPLPLHPAAWPHAHGPITLDPSSSGIAGHRCGVEMP